MNWSGQEVGVVKTGLWVWLTQFMHVAKTVLLKQFMSVAKTVHERC